MDSLDRIRIFQRVAEYGSFSEAARKLGIQPVAATRAVSALEKELGVSLLRRTTRWVGLTNKGANYLARTRRALAELEDAARATREQDGVARGQLVVTAPVLFGRMFIMSIVSNLLSTHPELAVRVMLSDRVMRLAEEGIDVAIRIARLPDSSLKASRLATVRQVWVASPSYLSKHGSPKTLADLASHDLIHFDTVTLNKEWRHGSKRLRLAARLRTDNADASIEAAIQGLGIARLFSYHVANHVAAGRLVYALPKLDREAVPVSALYQHRGAQSSALKAFLAAARAGLPGCPEL